MKINSGFYATVLGIDSYDATNQKHTTRTRPSSTHTLLKCPPPSGRETTQKHVSFPFHHFRFRHDQFPPVPCYLFVASRLSQYSPFRQTLFFRSLPADRRMVLTVSISQQKPAVGMFRAVAFHRICNVPNDKYMCQYCLLVANYSQFLFCFLFFV